MLVNQMLSSQNATHWPSPSLDLMLRQEIGHPAQPLVHRKLLQKRFGVNNMKLSKNAIIKFSIYPDYRAL